MSTVIGAGWLGRGLAQTLGADLVPRRRFADGTPLRGPVIIASGRAAIPDGEPLAQALQSELRHLRQVLRECDRQGIDRVIVLGSSDVCGMTEVITGSTEPAPDTVYAETKTAVEDEVVAQSHRRPGLTVVRLAPVHGSGKARSRLLVRAAQWPIVPLPNGGRHSIGFIHYDDAIRAVAWLACRHSPTVVAVGAGNTPLRTLMKSLARAQSNNLKMSPVPVPTGTTARWLAHRGPSVLAWALRLSSPRLVQMEVPVEPMSVEQAAERLVQECL